MSRRWTKLLPYPNSLPFVDERTLDSTWPVNSKSRATKDQ